MAGFLRRNAFLVAAVTLPAAVIALFAIATIVSRRSVASPAYDLVFMVMRPYERGQTVVTDFIERDGRVHARLRAINEPYASSWELLLFDHETSTVSEIPFEAPDTVDDEVQTVPVPAVANLRVSGESTAPDGYALEARYGSSGIIGNIFGMGGSRGRVSLVNGGRAVALDLPAPYRNVYVSSAQVVGWVLEER
jgi:hypothetical protein